ncbi:hypothetical protein NXS19_009435 [Fusarium pseudograminearum]|nr:hypothetical protein NXS19_009435 [Fusarium pseudograminearum]
MLRLAIQLLHSAFFNFHQHNRYTNDAQLYTIKMSGRKRNAKGAAAKQRPNKRGRMANDEPCEEAIRQAEILLGLRPPKSFELRLKSSEILCPPSRG